MMFSLEVVFLYFDMSICKSKFTLAFKEETTYKVAVKQLQVVGHAAGSATFALGGQPNI